MGQFYTAEASAFYNVQNAFVTLFDHINRFGEEEDGERFLRNQGFYIKNPLDNRIRVDWCTWREDLAVFFTDHMLKKVINLEGIEETIRECGTYWAASRKVSFYVEKGFLSMSVLYEESDIWDNFLNEAYAFAKLHELAAQKTGLEIGRCWHFYAKLYVKVENYDADKNFYKALKANETDI